MYTSMLILTLPLLVVAQAGPSNQTLSRPSTLRYPWQYQGCYTDNRDKRTVQSSRSSTSNTTTTIESCIALCANTTALPPALSGHTYNFAALSYGTECFCGLTLNPSATKVADEQCNYACSGNSSEPCGASDHVSVYWNGERQPVMSTGSRRWAPAGCYNDTPNARILSLTQSAGSSDMSVYVCTSACYNQQYKYAGLEYGRECYCGNVLGGGSPPMIDGASCGMLCAGNATEYCGGDGSISVYSARDTGSAEALRLSSVAATMAFVLLIMWCSVWVGLV